MKISIPEIKKARIEMLPLIDVIFLLLVVFIYTMLSMAAHNGMPVALPESTACVPEKQTVLSVTVDEGQALFINKNRVEIEALSDALRQMAIDGKDKNLLLFVDKSISYQFLFSVLDRIRHAGLDQISLQAHPEYAIQQ